MANITKEFLIMKPNKDQIHARATTLADAQVAAQALAEAEGARVAIYELVGGYRTTAPVVEALTVVAP
jgi:alpha-D-ribose 1-methylphosphonate 5-triphosphate synthase subunit PhnI